MNAKKLAPIATILAALVMGLPAAAEYRDHRRGDHGISEISRELAVATAALHRDVLAGRFGHGHKRRYALSTIDRLERNAKYFHRQVKREGVFDVTTRRAFQRLEASFQRATERLPVVRARRGVRRHFAQVAGLMAQVEHRLARLDRRHDDRRYGSRGDSNGWRLAWNHRH